MLNKIFVLLTLMVQLVYFEVGVVRAHANPQVNGSSNEIDFEDFKKFARELDFSLIERLPIQNNGRIKPLDTFARESILYIYGKNKFNSLTPVQSYLGLALYENSPKLPVIEVRDKTLRKNLNLDSKTRFISANDLEAKGIEALARPALIKSSENSKLLNPSERALIELFRQFELTKNIITGRHLLLGLQYSLNENVVQDKEKIVNELSTLFLNFLKVTVLKDFNQQREIAETLLNKAYQVPLDEISNRYRKRIGLELLYNKFQPFHWAAYLFILLGFCFLLPNFKKYQNPFLYFGALFLPFTLMVYGFITRILITGFSPVTNMYGTMLWLSFGMTIFNFVLLFLYKNYNLTAILSIIIGVVLLVTHQAPLVLSPDMDPIVAVLRNNFWLATHVLTVTISYAAFSLAMLISNYAMILKIAGKLNDQTMKTYSHYAYRMIQLGVFLLTLGIILGGVWADYSWGRFWGWDPKETWALIADLGFLIILHARFVGWVKDDTLLFWTPIAYLLVIMAWYGVNFILATGLHSYGFSSGGVSFVVGFVLAQILINLATFLIHKNSNAA